MYDGEYKKAASSANNVQQHRTEYRQIIIAGERNIAHGITNGQAPRQLVRAQTKAVVGAIHREKKVLPQRTVNCLGVGGMQKCLQDVDDHLVVGNDTRDLRSVAGWLITSIKEYGMSRIETCGDVLVPNRRLYRLVRLRSKLTHCNHIVPRSIR